MALRRTALGQEDYWQRFSAGGHRLELCRYRKDGHEKRSRYSLFVFPNGQDEATCCYNYEPEDPEDTEGLRLLAAQENDPEQRDLLNLIVASRDTNPLTQPVAYYGEHTSDSHATIGEAPNDLTIDQFKDVALEWAAKMLQIPLDVIECEFIYHGLHKDDLVGLPHWPLAAVAFRSMQRARELNHGRWADNTEEPWRLMESILNSQLPPDRQALLDARLSLGDLVNFRMPSGDRETSHWQMDALAKLWGAILIDVEEAFVLGIHISLLSSHVASLQSTVSDWDIPPDDVILMIRRDLSFVRDKVRAGLWNENSFTPLSEFDPLWPGEAPRRLQSEKGSGSGCFIATACYGSPNHPNVIELRRFRDSILATSWIGRILIRCYYRMSPPVANRLQAGGAVSRIICQWFLDPIVERLQRRRLPQSTQTGSSVSPGDFEHPRK